MNTSSERIVWDVHPNQFNKSGHLQKLIDRFQSIDFQQLIEIEIQKVKIFLDEWTQQLKDENARNQTYQSGSQIDLISLFRQTPQLSGVVYLSDNHVISESFFEQNPIDKRHLTDRVIDSEIKAVLPSWQDLTFSFPRQYQFDGFFNSWGFTRIERTKGEKNSTGVLLSVTTLDPYIMTLMQNHGFEYLAELYNHAWDGAIHDYIHHIALYTNPSFGIGKISPMSLANVNTLIDRWGADMLDTFNYEYWAHRTHRLITEKILTHEHKKKIITNAKKYFTEVRAFQKILLQKQGPSLVQKISNYLTQIYLWPLHILLHPFDPLFETLNDEINSLQVDQTLNLKHEISAKLSAVEKEEKNPEHPRAIALSETFKGLSLRKKLDHPLKSISWFDVMRLSVDLTVQRGVYEGWFHDQQVLYQNCPTSPHRAMLSMLDALQQTFPLFQKSEVTVTPYTLKGIIA